MGATTAATPDAAQFKPGGTMLDVMWCDPAVTVTARNSPAGLWNNDRWLEV